MSLNKQNSSTHAMHVVCAVIFLVFTWLYVYCGQSSVLAATQHVLSNGETTYSSSIGTPIILITLWLLQISVYLITRLWKNWHSLTYFPSMLLLLALTSAGCILDRGGSIGFWMWLIPLLLIVWGGVVYLLRQLQPMEAVNSTGGLFSKLMCNNVFGMVVMMALVLLLGNDNKVYSYRMRAEDDMIHGRYADACLAGSKSLQTDSSLTSLRIYALARQGELPQKLFTYPVEGSSRDLLPDSSTVRWVMLPTDSLYHFLGVRFKQPMAPMHYLNFILQHKLAKQPAADYLLCGYLLDCNLDAFVRHIGLYYNLNKPLPTHYREALTLYTHLRSHPFIVYHSTEMDADFQDLQQLMQTPGSKAERFSNLRDTYGNTYWYYYLSHQYYNNI